MHGVTSFQARTAMEIRNLGSTGLRVSSLGLGSGTLGREIGADDSCEILDYALDRGIT
jgi:aryl-alcohol dehydrogenase-like predicted oxidoreductase